MEASEKINLGFMFSNWYSGATLLAILLNNHEEVVCNGETFPFLDNEIDLYTCACGNALLQCDFYRNACSHILDETGSGWRKNSLLILPQFSRVPLLNKWLKSYNYFHLLRDSFLTLVPPYNMFIRRFLDDHITVYENACRIDGKTLYVDGTKSMRRAELFRRHRNMLFKVVYLVRDGRGFCCSYVKNKKPEENLTQAAQAWMEYNKNVEIFKKRYPEIPVLTIRYEDLCHEFESTMESILSFFGVSSGVVQYQEKEFHMLGNKMRKSFDGRIIEDLRWKKFLSSSEVSMITAIMEEDLRYYGYI